MHFECIGQVCKLVFTWVLYVVEHLSLEPMKSLESLSIKGADNYATNAGSFCPVPCNFFVLLVHLHRSKLTLGVFGNGNVD